ncbi:MAG: hypothetical protein D5R97_08110 [Candidatus Syntrophonatronum acetioxidans]|uniref:Uncharacterized protein n=1 Tax=Candidatus Syntrophonatronum acetioxidans TaxID=1795816 RepID=A0A424YBB2_9FIRM|nr:MAG: hypothetical protein D5R97_08110 [Candidatus Syntrophonatronum acetioxidans]
MDNITNQVKKITVNFNGSIWLNQASKEIHIKIDNCISTVSNNPNSKRYHPNLYKKLKHILQAHDSWIE